MTAGPRFLRSSKAINRVRAALRSWRREEQCRKPLSRAQQLLGAASVAAGVTVVGLFIHQLAQNNHQGRLGEQQEGLSTLRAKVLASRQTARDWAHWTEMYDYVSSPGQRHAFLDNNIRKAGLFGSGSVMLVFDARHRLLFSADRRGLNPRDRRSLASCIQPELQRLSKVQDVLLFLCDREQPRPYVGAVTPISDSRAIAAPIGSLAYLVPLFDDQIPRRSTRILEQLRRDLFALPSDQPQPLSDLVQPLRPQLQQRLLTAGGSRLLLRTPSRWASLPLPLLLVTVLLVLISVVYLAARMLWMLERRRERLDQGRRAMSRRAQLRRQQAEQQQRLIEQKLTSSLTAAVVAHEIQQPLSTILLQCRLALQELEQSKAPLLPGVRGERTSDDSLTMQLSARLRALSAEATRAVEITETMRMLLRNVNTPHTRVCLNDVIESCLLFFSRAIQKHRIALQTAGLDQPTTIAGDATQVQSAINNLIQNAIDAMVITPSGRAPTLKLSLDTLSTDTCDPLGTNGAGGQVRFRLADSGPGFGQADTGQPLTTSKPQGTGLGLFVVRTTMRNHGGSLRIGQSEELGGAEVELVWPSSSPAAAPAVCSTPAAG